MAGAEGALSDEYTKQQEAEFAEHEGWQGDYDGTDCKNCGRQRVLKCNNGKRVCEKCAWDQDANEYSAYPNR